MRIPAVCLVLLLTGSVAFAQRGAESDATPGPLALGEIQKLLDGYAIVQAQEALGMTDAEFGPFLPKLRELQDMRRRNEQERLRLIMELRRLTNPRAQATENDIRDRVRALRELQIKALNDAQRSYDSIDQSLNVRQQARFRIFEQEIEQRKLQLLMRARQQNRANRPLANPKANPK